MPTFTPAVSRRIVFWIEMAFLAILGVSGWLYITGGMPSWLAPPAALGPMPLGVPWYGALGGIAISLTGVFEHLLVGSGKPDGLRGGWVLQFAVYRSRNCAALSRFTMRVSPVRHPVIRARERGIG